MKTTTPENILGIACDWLDHGRRIALATVVETWGSAPRRSGAQMVVDADGVMMGSVSGGCVEGAVIIAAQDAIAEGRARLLTYGVSDHDAFAVGLACGGDITVLVEPVGAVMPKAQVQQLRDAVAARKNAAYRTTLHSQDSRVVTGAHARGLQTGLSDDKVEVTVAFEPTLRLVIVGAVHIAQSLAPMAQLSGFEIVVIDPRPDFAHDVRFDGSRIMDAWPDDALNALGLDKLTAVVTLTHDPKLDDPAILTALGTDVMYLGCLGSKRTHAKRLDRLRLAGVDQSGLDRIKGPVGLDIGAASPSEIAVSILAQVIQQFRI